MRVLAFNDYKNLPRLETAVNDATAVADVLRQRYGFEVTLLLNPTRDKVIRTLSVADDMSGLGSRRSVRFLERFETGEVGCYRRSEWLGLSRRLVGMAVAG